MATVARTPVLVLNASYEPINICGAKRALALVVAGTARAEVSRDRVVYPGVHMPSVIRLTAYRHIPKRFHPVSRKGIHLRDNGKCQYCGVRLALNEMTLDHILPQSRSGKSTWENLVACCKGCNSKKGDRLPHECVPPMLLLKKPRAGSVHTSRHLMREMASAEEGWQKYLYFN